MNQLKLIKIIVFIFTFLLIFGSMTLIGCFYHKLSKPSITAKINLAQTSTSAIKQIAADDGLLYILITDLKQPDKIIIFNPEKNAIVSNLVTY